MEKHILSLIKENNRVIIPNFGAFIIAKENGFTILFNNFLSFNDGLLIDHVVEHDKVSKEEANKLVDNYVDTLKEKLDSEGRYEIQGLGLFTKDASGILRFSQADDINGVEESEKTENTLLDIDADSTEDVKEVEEGISEETEEIDILKETPLVEVENETTKVEDKPKEPIIKKVESTSTSSSSHSYIEEDNSKRNRSIFIFAIIIIALAVMAVYFVFFHKKKEEVKKPAKTEKVIPKVKEKKVVTKPKQEDGIVAGPETKKVEKAKTKTVVPKAVVNNAKPHHLIVGSFKDTNNADKYLAKLRGMGYANCMAIQSNTMTLISIESFAKVYEAQTKQEELLEKHKMESWILTKRK
ncbi:HU family DNA-binding protein [Carboxylicivirga sp. N1Y90]|uniref:HU family DNA-binding protein n=1 Tax=Carboxylicivirga fragile TaxID=3417571 RepID=UPI003D32AEA5|nr:HU family DNA-binding protein [Marinilabiliaceae bacterium N1Y90]